MNEKFQVPPKWAKSVERPLREQRKEPLAPMAVLVEGQECFQIRLTNGMVAIVDKCDEYVCQFHWNPRKNRNSYYAQRNAMIDGRYTTVQMHRQVLMIEDSSVGVDHKNSNGLDNRRSNLRLASQHFNSANRRKTAGKWSSQFKGVTRKGIKWEAQLKCHGINTCLGRFETEESAARAYDRAAVKSFGEFARLNFPFRYGSISEDPKPFQMDV